ncbi:hypothetical protein [Streptomyces sp. NPDC055886]
MAASRAARMAVGLAPEFWRRAVSMMAGGGEGGVGGGEEYRVGVVVEGGFHGAAYEAQAQQPQAVPATEVHRGDC